MKKAVLPGSFDPITIGHEAIIRRGLDLFDEIIVAVGVYADKRYQFSLEERLAFIRATFNDEPKVQVTTYQGLTVDYCREINADFILRGLRNPADFEFEKAIAHTNRTLTEIETVFLLTASNKDFISSSIVRDVLKNNGNIEAFVPKATFSLICNK